MNYSNNFNKLVGTIESIGEGIVSKKGLTNVANGILGLFCQRTKQGLRILKLELAGTVVVASFYDTTIIMLIGICINALMQSLRYKDINAN